MPPGTGRGRPVDLSSAPIMSRSSRRAYVIVAAILALGLWASVQSGDWSWLTRAGSAVVAVGILLTSSHIREHGRQLRRWRSQLGSGPGSQSQRDWAERERAEGLLRSRTQEEDIWEVEGHGLYILIVGTLVWGFGDLIGNWMAG